MYERVQKLFSNSAYQEFAKTLWNNEEDLYLQLEYDIEELRKSALKMERRAQEAESQVETATTMQSELEQQLEEANARIKVLAEKAKECESIPGLLRHLEESSKQIEKLKAAQEELQAGFFTENLSSFLGRH